MGFLAEAFGYDTEMPKRPPTPQLDPRAAEFQQELYPAIESGLAGKGMTATTGARSLRDLLASLKTSYLNFQEELPSFMARTVQREDEGVREFLRKSAESEYARQAQGARDDYAMQNFADIDTATQAAFGALGTEKKLAGGITNAYNETMMRRAFAPDFESELWGGIGGAAGTVLGGWKSKTPEQTQPPMQYGDDFSPAQSYASNFSTADPSGYNSYLRQAYGY